MGKKDKEKKSQKYIFSNPWEETDFFNREENYRSKFMTDRKLYWKGWQDEISIIWIITLLLVLAFVHVLLVLTAILPNWPFFVGYGILLAIFIKNEIGVFEEPKNIQSRINLN